MFKTTGLSVGRFYATYTKRVAPSTTTSKVLVKKASSKLPSSSAATSTTATSTTTDTTDSSPQVNQIQEEEEFFDPPEFNLQTGVSSSKSASPNAFKGKTLNETFIKNLHDSPGPSVNINEIHWPTSYFGLGAEPFSEETQKILAEPIPILDIEIKPDGLIYLPEIKYRRILNRAFGAGAWGLIPRSQTIVTDKLLTREYALICRGRLVSIARGEQDYFSQDGIPTATEGCRSNALMRCCKDLGIASELWDPNFIREFKQKHVEEKFVEHVTTKRKRKLWKRKDRTFDYPYKVV